jgi:hypothetical protein
MYSYENTRTSVVMIFASKPAHGRIRKSILAKARRCAALLPPFAGAATAPDARYQRDRRVDRMIGGLLARSTRAR